jgi:4-amino-4-deoxy-L-arabinose transferase-like glycosyltransferase
VSRTARPRSRTEAPALLTALARLPLEARLLAVVCVVALVLRLWPLGGGSSEYDEGVYWQSLRAMATGHPLFSSVFSSQPPAFLLGVYPVYRLFGQTLPAARFAIALSSLVGIIAIYYAGRAVGTRWVGLAAAVVLAADPLYLTMSHTLEAEIPSIAWQIVCVALAASAMHATGRTRHALAAAAGVALSMGVLTKLLAIVVLVPAVLYLAQPIFATPLDTNRRPRLPDREQIVAAVRAAWPALARFALAALGTGVLVLLPFVTRLGSLYDQVVRFHLEAAHVSQVGLRGNLSSMLRTTAYPALSFVVALVGVVLVYRTAAWRIVPPLLWLVASFIALARQQPLFGHHLVVLAPPLALSVAVVLVAALDAAPQLLSASHAGQARWTAAAPIVLGALLAAVLLASLASTIPEDQAAAQPESPAMLEMAAALRATSLPGDYVVTDDQLLAGLADRDVPPQLVDTSLVRIQSGYLTATQLEAIITTSDARYVLFASGRFDKITGFRAWVERNFTRFADFGAGRVLYIKKPAENGPTLA